MAKLMVLMIAFYCSIALSEVKYVRCDSRLSELAYLTSQTQQKAEDIKNQILVEIEKNDDLNSHWIESKEVMECVLEKIKTTEIVCISEQPSRYCQTETVGASQGTLVMGLIYKSTNRINICPFYWESTENFQLGGILHEATHICGTTDAAYFGRHGSWFGEPRDIKGNPWSNIADTYAYWARYGFCIPGKTCK